MWPVSFVCTGVLQCVADTALLQIGHGHPLACTDIVVCPGQLDAVRSTPGVMKVKFETFIIVP